MFHLLLYRGKITTDINYIIKRVEQSHEYGDKRSEIANRIIKLYKDNKDSYTDGDLQKRKSVLMASNHSFCELLMNEVMNSYKSAFTILFTSVFSVLFLSAQKIIDQETLREIDTLMLTAKTSILVFLALWVLSALLHAVLTFRGRKYRRYIIIELELEIIKTLLEKNYDTVKQEIIS